jgi:hypothetical protein
MYIDSGKSCQLSLFGNNLGGNTCTAAGKIQLSRFFNESYYQPTNESHPLASGKPGFFPQSLSEVSFLQLSSHSLLASY